MLCSLVFQVTFAGNYSHRFFKEILTSRQTEWGSQTHTHTHTLVVLVILWDLLTTRKTQTNQHQAAARSDRRSAEWSDRSADSEQLFTFCCFTFQTSSALFQHKVGCSKTWARMLNPDLKGASPACVLSSTELLLPVSGRLSSHIS